MTQRAPVQVELAAAAILLSSIARYCSWMRSCTVMGCWPGSIQESMKWPSATMIREGYIVRVIVQMSLRRTSWFATDSSQGRVAGDVIYRAGVRPASSEDSPGHSQAYRWRDSKVVTIISHCLKGSSTLHPPSRPSHLDRPPPSAAKEPVGCVLASSAAGADAWSGLETLVWPSSGPACPTSPLASRCCRLASPARR